MSSFVSVDAKYHDCKVLALRSFDRVVDVLLSVERAEQFVPERAFTDGDGWVSGRLEGPLELRLVYTSAVEATAEATLFDHWRIEGSVLEVTKSIESQGILVVEPGTGLFSGMRMSAAHLDEPESDPVARP
jgi:hypothetical protein